MRERIVFLDRDGVLNTLQFCFDVNDTTALDPEKVLLLKSIFDEIDEIDVGIETAIVISSSGRLGPEDSWDLPWREKFAAAGWEDVPIIGRTPDLSGFRGDEIAAWLVEHFGENFSDEVVFAIIDDDDDMRPDQEPFFVRCASEIGFTEADRDATSKILGTMTPQEMTDALWEIRRGENVFVIDTSASAATQRRQADEILEILDIQEQKSDGRRLRPYFLGARTAAASRGGDAVCHRRV